MQTERTDVSGAPLTGNPTWGFYGSIAHHADADTAGRWR